MKKIEARNKRKEWIDALRALAMILVIYGHRVREWNGYFVFTSPIKIPLFFAITGYVFNQANRDFLAFLKKMIRTIMIPWLVLSVAPYIVVTPIKGINYLLSHIKAIIIGQEFWYIPCCIVAEIIWFLLSKYFERIWQLLAASSALFVIGILLYRYDAMSGFMINRACTVQVFLLIGMILRRYEDTIGKMIGKVPCILLGTGFYVGLGIISMHFYPGKALDVHLNEYYNYVICLLMIVTGILMLFIVAKKYIKKYLTWWLLIGQNTLVIYLLHSYVIKVTVRIFNILHIPINQFSNLFITFAVSTICLFISLLLKRYAPYLMGVNESFLYTLNSEGKRS